MPTDLEKKVEYGLKRNKLVLSGAGFFAGAMFAELDNTTNTSFSDYLGEGRV